MIVETEFPPAAGVDREASATLGTRLRSTGKDTDGVLSVVLPEGLGTGDLRAVDGAACLYATHCLDAAGEPAQGECLEGGVDDLADAIGRLSLSGRQLARGAEALEAAVAQTAGLLSGYAGELH